MVAFIALFAYMFGGSGDFAPSLLSLLELIFVYKKIWYNLDVCLDFFLNEEPVIPISFTKWSVSFL